MATRFSYCRSGVCGNSVTQRARLAATALFVTDEWTLTNYMGAPPVPASTEPDAETSDARFSRTGGNGFLGEAPDEQLWEQGGGFTANTDDVRGRLDD